MNIATEQKMNHGTFEVSFGQHLWTLMGMDETSSAEKTLLEESIIELVVERSEKYCCRDMLHRMYWVAHFLFPTDQGFGRICYELLCRFGLGFWDSFNRVLALEARDYYGQELEGEWFSPKEAVCDISNIAQNLDYSEEYIGNSREFMERVCAELFKRSLIDDMEGEKSYSVPVMRLI